MNKIEVDRGFLEHIKNCMTALKKYNDLGDDGKVTVDAITDIAIEEVEAILSGQLVFEDDE